MGYNLYIGEAEVIVYMEERHARMGVRQVSDGWDDTPADIQFNTISPSYPVWRNFCRETGLYSVFYAPECPECFDKPLERSMRGCVHCGLKSVWWEVNGKQYEGLMKNRPGAAPLTEDHLNAFREARRAWVNKPEEYRQEVGCDEEGTDQVLRRLNWLYLWTKWALENCKNPTFAND